MRILIAMDSFKGTLSQRRASEIIYEALKTQNECAILPYSDGGEGFLDAVKAIENCKEKTIRVLDSQLKPKMAIYLQKGAKVYLEAAQVIGLEGYEGKVNPLYSTSYGFGKLIDVLLNRGINEFHIGLGGSATSDVGSGLLQALGGSFLDANGREIFPYMKDILKVKEIDIRNLHSNFYKANFSFYSDVNNQLLGPTGAVYSFAKQKGGDDLDLLEIMTGHLNNLYKVGLDDKASAISAGACGGLLMPFYYFHNPEVERGADLFLKSKRACKLLSQCDLVISGEGRLDETTFLGKGPLELLEVCKKYSKPLYLIVGQAEESIVRRAKGIGVKDIVRVYDEPVQIAEIRDKAEEDFQNAVKRLCCIIKP